MNVGSERSSRRKQRAKHEQQGSEECEGDGEEGRGSKGTRKSEPKKCEGGRAGGKEEKCRRFATDETEKTKKRMEG